MGELWSVFLEYKIWFCLLWGFWEKNWLCYNDTTSHCILHGWTCRWDINHVIGKPGEKCFQNPWTWGPTKVWPPCFIQQRKWRQIAPSTPQTSSVSNDIELCGVSLGQPKSIRWLYMQNIHCSWLRKASLLSRQCKFKAVFDHILFFITNI